MIGNFDKTSTWYIFIIPVFTCINKEAENAQWSRMIMATQTQLTTTGFTPQMPSILSLRQVAGAIVQIIPGQAAWVDMLLQKLFWRVSVTPT